MIKILAIHQNWAKATPLLALASSLWIFTSFDPASPQFWALINIPLYFIHQIEEHLWPGGFKHYINEHVNHDPQGVETLTDEKVFWINILLVWLAFALLGALVFNNIGFGIIIIIFSLINCATHIRQAIIDRRWNPGLVIASLQFAVSIYAAWFVTANGLDNRLLWWIGGIFFSLAVHILLFRIVMTSSGKTGEKELT